jgi:hypothetical protein
MGEFRRWSSKTLVGPLLAGLLLGSLSPVWADFEIKAPDGRTLLIKDDGTWRVVAAADAAASGVAATPGPQAELQLTKRTDLPGACEFTLTLVNSLPYEIQSLVPELVVHRADGVAYTSQSVYFGGVKPGDQRTATARFLGIACTDVVRLLVQRGDRCQMGDLNRFSPSDGQCLTRVRLVPSSLLKFEK